MVPYGHRAEIGGHGMGIVGIDHWVIVAGDLERSLDFYRKLGFEIAWETRPGRPDMATIRIGGAQKINVHGPEAPARPGYLGARRPTAGGADFCLEWRGSVDEVLALLAAHGIAVEAGPGPRTCARGTSTSVYVRDPDDNLVEFTVYPAGAMGNAPA
jgi:catechol 2,3-dioxygenase-like lactoylglutathione lyase family enzyme